MRLCTISCSSTSCAFAQSGTFKTALGTSTILHSKTWIIDSGATNHITKESNVFLSYIPCSSNQKVQVANGSLTPISGKGNVLVTPNITLSSVLHVPNTSYNLLSISKLRKFQNCFVTFLPTHCVFQDLITGKVIGSAKEREGLYYLVTEEQGKIQDHQIKGNIEKERELWLIHERLGHPSFVFLKTLYPKLCINLDPSKFQCKVCEFSKNHRISYPLGNKRSEIPFSLIHTDVWGPLQVPCHLGAKWFISFIDDCIRTTWIYLLKEKTNTSLTLKQFHQMIRTQFNAKLQIVRLDNGREYLNQCFQNWTGH